MTAELTVRPATLDDTGAISALFRSRIDVWQRLNTEGQVENVPYERMSIYDRWLHGGPWMSIETGAVQLCHLLGGAGLPLVAALDGEPVAYAEVYHSNEPKPFGPHLHLAHLIVRSDLGSSDVEPILADAIRQEGKARKCQLFTATRLGAVSAAEALESMGDAHTLVTLRRFSLAARTGQIFYQANEYLNADSAQINGWAMPVGRLSCARQEWETLWPRLWEAVPEIRRQRSHRLRFTAAGQEAFVCCRQRLYDERTAEVSCWSPRPLTNQLLSAIRDWSHRAGYRTLLFTVAEDTVKILGSEAEPDGFLQEVIALPL